MDRMATRSDGHPIGWPFDRVVIRSVVSGELRFDVSFCSLSVAMVCSHISIYYIFVIISHKGSYKYPYFKVCVATYHGYRGG
ncbi:hypothetical protein HanRHA438_Chr17g0802291 [Helianthus annuus]|nr:hypothetical protein HanRHA438_Chr17g0802291 [Helianthus annuus]